MPNPILMRKLRPNRSVCVYICTADNKCRKVDSSLITVDCGVDTGDPSPYWTHIIEDFDGYTVSVSGTYVGDTALGRGRKWAAAADVGETSARQIVAFDDLSTYTDGQDLIGANGGQGWLGGWSQ